MTDATAATATLRAEFERRAVLPNRQIAAAHKFIDHLAETLASGAQPSEKDIAQGKKLLRQIENQTTIYEYNAVILAGQECASEGALDSRIRDISKGITVAQSTSQRLRDTLKDFD